MSFICLLPRYFVAPEKQTGKAWRCQKAVSVAVRMAHAFSKDSTDPDRARATGRRTHGIVTESNLFLIASCYYK